MSDTDRASGFFRCPVQNDQSRAVIYIGCGRIPAVLQETSIDGFTLTVAPKHASRVRLGRPWLLKTRAEKVEVHAEWLFHAPKGQVQLGVRRLRDLTPAPAEKSGWSLFGSRRASQGNTAELVFAGLVLVIFLIMSLPGIGEQLGTAPRIRAAVESVVQTLTVIVRGVI
ncbi:hypothetical protein [Candidatus Laterigemmans baculatus]|uniref:hypothetical protein n=1 Tax=Candidatus Laterigemmans baculatus TaxID=2770505 RepID=UPI0013DCB227|nr:hypothetical protein [Candidatus Laterigemmans baculatus]